MADEIRTILFDFKGDASDLQRASGQASGSMQTVEGSVGKTKGALKQLAPVAKAAGIAAAAMAAKWAIDGIGMAQTAEAVAKSFDTTFGDAADDMVARNEDLRKAMGLSEAEFQRMAITMGQTATATGMNREEAAAFSEEMITMAADVAAFNGDLGQSEEVLGAFQAAIRGEFDPMERFGIAIKQSDVNMKALEMTTKSSTAELTAQEKQAATLALIQEQLGDETGAMAASMESGATAQNELNAEMKDNQQAVGEALLPLKAMGMELISKLMPVLSALAPLLDLIVTLFEVLWLVLGPVITAVGALVGWLADLVEWLIKGSGFVDRLKRGIDSLRVALKNTFSLRMPSWLKNLNPSSWGRVFRHSGGVVPGARGQSVNATLQGGETVLPAGMSRSMAARGGGGGGTTINVTVNAGVGDPMEIGRQVADVLGEYSRQVAGIDLELRS